jgi:hypothetical protein
MQASREGGGRSRVMHVSDEHGSSGKLKLFRQGTHQQSRADFLRMDEVYLAAAIQLQRAFRSRMRVHSDYGPCLFVDRRGRPSSFGRIYFQNTLRSAKFLRISDTSSLGLLVSFMLKHWSLPSPEVIFSVTGGAADFNLTPNVRDAFYQGLIFAAVTTQAWIISGGTDTGVMKLVGEAIRASGATTPTVGIVPWGAVAQREELEGRCGDDVVYDNSLPPPRNHANLNSHHTHFLLVDSNVENSSEEFRAFGSEIAVRTTLEGRLSELRNIMVVTVVCRVAPAR